MTEQLNRLLRIMATLRDPQKTYNKVETAKLNTLTSEFDSEVFVQEVLLSSRSDGFWRYFGNVAGFVSLTLPGVFGTNPDHSVNVSLWTIPYEIGCYVLIGGLILFRCLHQPRIVLALCVAFGVIAVAFRDFENDSWLPPGGEAGGSAPHERHGRLAPALPPRFVAHPGKTADRLRPAERGDRQERDMLELVGAKHTAERLAEQLAAIDPDDLAVEGFDRLRRFVIVGHLDEPETLGASRVAIHDDLCRLDRSTLRESVDQNLIGSGVRKITNV